MKITDLRSTSLLLSDLKTTDHIGFTTTEHEKGYLVYVGDTDASDNPCVSAINVSSHFQACNSSFGVFEDNSNAFIEKALNLSRCSSIIAEVVIFPTRKDLYKWLAED